MNKIISVNNVNVSYDKITVLKNVTVDFYDTDFVGIIGPNGGGKSTLIKALLNLTSYTGKITYLNGLTRNKIGYMPQINSFDRNFPIKVNELILSGLQAQNGITKKYIKPFTRNDICNLMEKLNILHLSNRAISELSGGELQRALLCRSIINNPKLLILDEPTNFVDNRFEGELYQLLNQLNQTMAIIMVSHDLGTISSVVKNIVCVNKTIHRHDTNILSPEMFENYHCPIQIIAHGAVPHTVLASHDK